MSKLYVPTGFDFIKLLDVLSTRVKVAENHKYFNNYEYNKAIYLVNGRPHYDSGNLLLVEDESIASPVSVLYYSFYNDLSELKKQLTEWDQNIQCIVAENDILDSTVGFGKSQQPELWDYADGADTIRFLLSL